MSGTRDLVRQAVRDAHLGAVQTALAVQDLRDVHLVGPPGCPPDAALEVRMDATGLLQYVRAVDAVDRDALARRVVAAARGGDPGAVDRVRVAVDETLRAMVGQSHQGRQTIRDVHVTACNVVVTSDVLIDMVVDQTAAAAEAALAAAPNAPAASPSDAPNPEPPPPPPPPPSPATAAPATSPPLLPVLLLLLLAVLLLGGVAAAVRSRRGRRRR